MPALYIVGFLFFSISYLVNKIGLISYYVKSTSQSGALSSASKTIFFLSLIVHVSIGLFMITDPNLIFLQRRPEWDFQIFDFYVERSDSAESGQIARRNFLQKRIQYGYQQLYLIFFILYIGFFIFGNTLGEFAYKSLQITGKSISRFCVWCNYQCFVKNGRKQRCIQRHPSCYVCCVVFCCCNRVPKIKKTPKPADARTPKEKHRVSRRTPENKNDEHKQNEMDANTSLNLLPEQNQINNSKLPLKTGQPSENLLDLVNSGQQQAGIGSQR